MANTEREQLEVKMRSLGLDGSIVDTFSDEWKKLEVEGYEMEALFTGAAGSVLDGQAGCIICSKNASPVHWEKVITPSQDCAALYLVCQDCDDQHVPAALRQKALGRLLKERNTRPN
jgi:hypothetical protein